MQISKQGFTIDFIDNTPPISYNIKQCMFARHEIVIVDQEVDKLLNKGFIEDSTLCTGDFLSIIFTRPKKDGSCCMVLNLRELNEYVFYQNFEMEALHDVLNITVPFAWLTSVDLGDAFYSVPVHKKYHKYFKFFWKDEFYVFKGMPNGYGPAIRLFTKMLKAPFAWLRARGHMSVVYVNDTYLQGNKWQECLYNVKATVSLLCKFGFTIHLEKSQLMPVH